MTFNDFVLNVVKTFYDSRQVDVALLTMLNSLPSVFLLTFGCLWVLANLSVVIKFFKGWL